MLGTDSMQSLRPRGVFAARPRVGGITPRLSRPQVLWKADELFVVQ